MVITFSLPIFVNLKDSFWFAIIEKSSFNKKPPADSELDTGSANALSNYKREEIETMLSFVNKDGLSCTT